MNLTPPISNLVGQTFPSAGSRNFPVPSLAAGNSPGLVPPSRAKSRPAHCAAFSLVEVLIVITLLALIVLALMDVFSSTQRAFRASVTQTDVLEGSRAAMELITTDLRAMAPSMDRSNMLDAGGLGGYTYFGVNFFVTNNNDKYYYAPLPQSLAGSSYQRLNLLQWFFILGRQNNKWTGVGYAVNSASTTDIYPLFRFYEETNTTNSSAGLFNDFVSDVNRGCTNMSHVIDGVVHLVVRASDLNGILLTNGYALNQVPSLKNTWFSPPFPPLTGEVGFAMFNNALPASVEVQMAVLEDQPLRHVAALATPNTPVSPAVPAQWNYLQSQAGRVHLFRQQVNILNVDRAAYQ